MEGLLLCSPMTRVAKVLWAAAKRKRTARRNSDNNPASSYGGPAHGYSDLSLAAAMRKTHSYEWLQNAVVTSPAEASGPPPLSPSCRLYLMAWLELLAAHSRLTGSAKGDACTADTCNSFSCDLYSGIPISIQQQVKVHWSM